MPRRELPAAVGRAWRWTPGLGTQIRDDRLRQLAGCPPTPLATGRSPTAGYLGIVLGYTTDKPCKGSVHVPTSGEVAGQRARPRGDALGS